MIKINSKLDLVKLCKNNINMKYSSNNEKYDIKYDQYSKLFNSKKEYIEYLIGLVTLIKENNYNKFNITFSIFAIIISIFSFIITAFSFIENNEDYKILNLFMFCICILIIIINISCLFLKHFEIKSTSYVVKVYNFENYLKKELEKINVGKNYLYYD